MAAKWRKVDPRIWHDERFSTLSTFDKLIAVYCLTSSQANRIGLFHISPGMAAEQLGMTTDTYAKGIRRVCRTLRWVFDERVNVVFIPNWWRYNGACGPKCMTGNLADLHDVPQTPLVKQFLENKTHLTAAESRVMDTYTIGIGGVCAFGAQEQEQEQEKEEPPIVPQSEVFEDSSSDNGQPSTSLAKRSAAFENFWQAFPRGRRKSKGAARKAWDKAAKKADPGELITAAAEYASSEEGRGEFVKMPSTWLNQECWLDDRAAWKRADSSRRDHEDKIVEQFLRKGGSR